CDMASIKLEIKDTSKVTGVSDNWYETLCAPKAKYAVIALVDNKVPGIKKINQAVVSRHPSLPGGDARIVNSIILDGSKPKFRVENDGEHNCNVVKFTVL